MCADFLYFLMGPARWMGGVGHKKTDPQKKLRSSFSAVIKGGSEKERRSLGLVVSSSSSFSSCRVDTLMR